MINLELTIAQKAEYKEKVLEAIQKYPGVRKREISSFAEIPLVTTMRLVSELEKEGKVKTEVYNDPANMESYIKHYIA